MIRRAVAADADRLTALARAAKAHRGYPAAWMTARERDLTITAAYLGEHRVFVAEDDAAEDGAAVAGFCSLVEHGDAWMLEHVWVDPRRHGRGTGRALVRRALDEAAALRPGIVTLNSDPHAAGFHARLGAHAAGTVPAPIPGAPERALPRARVRGARAGDR